MAGFGRAENLRRHVDCFVSASRIYIIGYPQWYCVYFFSFGSQTFDFLTELSLMMDVDLFPRPENFDWWWTDSCNSIFNYISRWIKKEWTNSLHWHNVVLVSKSLQWWKRSLSFYNMERILLSFYTWWPEPKNDPVLLFTTIVLVTSCFLMMARTNNFYDGSNHTSDCLIYPLD